MITVLNPFAGQRLRTAHDLTPSTAAERVEAADSRARVSLEWYEACAAQTDPSALWSGWVESSRHDADADATYAGELRTIADRLVAAVPARRTADATR